MWKRKNKNKHLNKKTNKEIEKEKEARAERFLNSLEAKIQQLEFKLNTLKNENDLQQTGILSKKIKEAEERIVPHTKEKIELEKGLEDVKQKAKMEEIQKQNFLHKKNQLIELHKSKISSLEQKIQNFKTGGEIESVIVLLEKKNKKLTERIRKTNEIKNQRKSLKKELKQLKLEEETGSWKNNLTESELLKIEQQGYVVQQLTCQLEKQEKRLKKIQFQKRINSDNSATDFVRIKQKLKENNNKILIATNDNKALQKEILETKELLGEEANTNSIECQTEDSLTDSESSQINSSSSKNICSSSLIKQTLNEEKLRNKNQKEIQNEKEKEKENSNQNKKTENENENENQNEKKKENKNNNEKETKVQPLLSSPKTSNPLKEPTLDSFKEEKSIHRKKNNPISVKTVTTEHTSPKKSMGLTKQLQSVPQNSQTSVSYGLLNLPSSNHQPKITENATKMSNSLPSLPFQSKKKKKDITIDSLQTLLSIPIGIDYFKEYLDTCLCQENIMFWVEVKSMKQNSKTQKVNPFFLFRKLLFELFLDFTISKKFDKKIFKCIFKTVSKLLFKSF
ncbi:regulator of g protein signaling-related [Anaeramoeba flamelloides]|uniref:Regulator of g protein signaling-related n=1 Tax=Anaeramoeba flamelloides TaxID=1746091 RepID=A0ABQ8Y1R8_9EUKA|nr:regulator of g protein signaling-related [Anaeramoeba flamelloides]